MTRSKESANALAPTIKPVASARNLGPLVHDPETDRTIPAILLAAGASTRLGRPKQLLELGGERLLERMVRVAREAGCAPVLVVLGAHAEEILATCSLDGAILVRNTAWEEGMASSVRSGLARLTELGSGSPGSEAPVQSEAAQVLARLEAFGHSGTSVPGVILMVCDQPAVTSEHLRALARAGETTASRYAGRNGVPAFIAAEALSALAALRGDSGARALLQRAAALDLPGGELDIDTDEDLAAAMLGRAT